MVFEDQELVYESYTLFQDGSNTVSYKQALRSQTDLDLHTGSATSYL